MVLSADISLPTEEELTVEEVKLGSPAIRASAFHLGKYCENVNNEYILCKTENEDARKCLEEGKAVTSCSLEFFRKVKKSCYEEFAQYENCLDKSSSLLEYKYCRKTQSVFDKCMMEKLNIERPPYGYFCEAKVVDTKRPKPEPEPPAIYPDATPSLPEDYPRPPAKYGSRFHVFN